jgi:hypothetical protein
LFLLEALFATITTIPLLVVVVWVSKVKIQMTPLAYSIREIVLVFPCVVFVAFSAIPIAQFFVELGCAVWITFSVAQLFAFTAYPNAPIVALSFGFGVAFAVPLAVLVAVFFFAVKLVVAGLTSFSSFVKPATAVRAGQFGDFFGS